VGNMTNIIEFTTRKYTTHNYISIKCIDTKLSEKIPVAGIDIILMNISDYPPAVFLLR